MIERHRMKLVWKALAPLYTQLDGAPTVSETLLNEVEVRCRAAFSTFKAFHGRPIELPLELRSFYLAAQDRLSPIRPGEGFQFYASTWLATDGLHFADEAEGDSTPWLEIGTFGGNAWAFICCDPEDGLFGHVVARTDSTPWSQLVYENETWIDVQDFLEHLLSE